MPWEVVPVSDIRLAFVHQVLSLHHSVAAACRKFGISRKTGHKWLARYRHEPGRPLHDHCRRPHSTPARTSDAIEDAILHVRDQFRWGPRKIRAFLLRQGHAMPSIRTVGAVLSRHGRIALPPPPPPPLQRFERAQPNELWQCDFKGFLEVARQRIYPFTVLDDHSRFLLAVQPCFDLTMATAWNVLWQVFAEFGLPDRLLCDNAFGSAGRSLGLSWFEVQLLRLDIHPCHGRPYHPQTQGKVERLHGTLQREVWPFVRRDALDHFAADVNHWRTTVYNLQRPHQSLADLPPLSRWRPSSRPRPAVLPLISYPPASILRKVTDDGDIGWRGYRIRVGRGLTGESVCVHERDGAVAICYGAYQVRCLPTDTLQRGHIL